MRAAPAPRPASPAATSGAPRPAASAAGEPDALVPRRDQPSIDRTAIARLLVRRDGPGLARFAFQCAAFAACSLLTVHLAAEGSALRWAALLPTGAALYMFFPAMHEAGHGTAFATPWLNRLVLWISAPLMLQSPTLFREFHFEHHRSTNDPARDPEVAPGKGLIGHWPTNPVTYLFQASGQYVMVGKVFFVLAPALLPFAFAYPHHSPWVRPRHRRRVSLECALVAIGLGAAAAWGVSQVPGFAFWLLAWPVAHLLLGIQVMAEHTGLARSGTQAKRSRTTRSNALVRAAMWNMNWHTEHHAFPAVPFHALPELGGVLGAQVLHRSPGYAAFHAEALRRSLGF